MHGIILHEEYRERMKRLSPEDLGKLVQNMFRIDDGEMPVPFGDDYLDFFSETVCGRVQRDIDLSEKQRANGKKGGGQVGNTNAKRAKNEPKTSQIQPKNNPKTNPNTNTNNQLPITNINNKHKKTNSFVDGCTKSDIDFDSLEIKVVKN